MDSSVYFGQNNTNNLFHQWPLYHFDQTISTYTGHIHAQSVEVWNQHHPPHTNGPAASFFYTNRQAFIVPPPCVYVYITQALSKYI